MRPKKKPKPQDGESLAANMILLTEYAEVNQLPNGLIQHTQYVKKIAYRENGSLRAILQDWNDSGDSTRPHMVEAAPLISTVGNDGMRRIHPTRELDRYMEIGQPFVKIGGVWTQVGLGTPNRSGNTLTWTRPQTLTKIVHGGHFIEMTIELLNGFVPEDSQIAFPVGLTGLTRNGARILRDGTVVAFLPRPVMVDGDNPFIFRPITHQFTVINGQAYWLMTLPNLTGMSRPIIDPTFSVQPDATAGKDTRIYEAQPTFNFGILNSINAGKVGTGSDQIKGILQFDLSSIPANSVISAATVTIRCSSESITTDFTVSLHRGLVVWYEGIQNGAAPGASEDGSTWNHRNANGSVAWSGGAGGASGSDYAASATDTKTITGTNVNFAYNVLADVRLMINGDAVNNGWWLIGQQTTNSSNKGFYSSDAGNASDKPQISITYAAPGDNISNRGILRGVLRGAR